MIGNLHVVADRISGADATTQATSTATTDYKTVTQPEAANAFLISCETTSCRFSLDGVNPDATNGHVLPKDGQPYYVPVKPRSLKVASTAAANSVVTVTWLE
jgi:hypothetical protein